MREAALGPDQGVSPVDRHKVGSELDTRSSTCRRWSGTTTRAPTAGGRLVVVEKCGVDTALVETSERLVEMAVRVAWAAKGGCRTRKEIAPTRGGRRGHVTGVGGPR